MSFSAPLHIDNGAGVDLGRDRKGDTRRDIGLDKARNDIDGRTLRTDDEMHARRTRLL